MSMMSRTVKLTLLAGALLAGGTALAGDASSARDAQPRAETRVKPAEAPPAACDCVARGRSGFATPGDDPELELRRSQGG